MASDLYRNNDVHQSPCARPGMGSVRSMTVAVVVLAVLLAAAGVALVVQRRSARRAGAAAADRLSEARAGLDATRADVARVTEDLAGVRADLDGCGRARQAAERRADELAAVTEALWSLELGRSRRTWRQSVAPVPPPPHSPFDGTDDPLPIVVETEASALREEVGAVVDVDWDGVVEGTPRRLLVLRVAQELLAEAARDRRAATLRVSGPSPVRLTLSATDDHEPFVVPVAPLPPGVASVSGPGRDTTVEVRDAPAPCTPTTEPTTPEVGRD